MTKKTAIILFVAGFILWYMSLKKPVTVTVPAPVKPASSGGFLDVVVTPTPTVGPLTALGFSWATTHEMSFWAQAGYLPTVTLFIPGSNVSGAGWVLGTPGPSESIVNTTYNTVKRYNPTTLNVGGVGPNTKVYALVSQPGTSNSITVEFTTPSISTNGIINIPLVPVAVPNLVNGIPTWLSKFGVSYDPTRHDASLWFDSTLSPLVRLELPGGNITGIDGYNNTAKQPEASTVAPYDFVLRLNANVPGTAALLPNTSYTAIISNPANSAETVAITFRPSNAPAGQIIDVPLVVAGTTGGGGTPVVPPVDPTENSAASIIVAQDNPGGGINTMLTLRLVWSMINGRKRCRIFNDAPINVPQGFTLYYFIDEDGQSVLNDKYANPYVGALQDYGSFEENYHLSIMASVRTRPDATDYPGGPEKIAEAFAQIHTGTMPN